MANWKQGRGNRGDRRRGGPYRARTGLLFGVCAGLAAYFDFSVFWTRVIVLIAFLCTGIWPVGIAYLVAALLMKPEPVLPLEDANDAEFYNSYAASRSMAAQRIKRSCDSLNRRIERLETLVTSKEFDWERRLNQI